MPSDLCFEYHPRWTDILPQLVNAIKNNDSASISNLANQLEDRDRQIENFIKTHVCGATGGGVSSYCHRESYSELLSGGDPVIVTLTMPRTVGNKAQVTISYQLSYLNGSPYVNYNVETHPYADGSDLFYNALTDSNPDNNSIVYSSVISYTYLIEIPDGAGDFEVGFIINNYGYADTWVSNAFLTVLDVGTAGDPANCLQIGS